MAVAGRSAADDNQRWDIKPSHVELECPCSSTAVSTTEERQSIGPLFGLAETLATSRHFSALHDRSACIRVHLAAPRINQVEAMKRGVQNAGWGAQAQAQMQMS